VVLNEVNLSKREQYMQAVEALEGSGNVLFVGRLAEYKYYNMDQVILRALEKSHEWLKIFNR
jgi:UDP-galactopyranose mutase